MEYPELVVTWKQGGAHVKDTDGTIDIRTTSILTLLNIVGSMNMQTRVEYSNEPLYPPKTESDKES